MRTSLSKIRLTIGMISFISEIDREGSEVHGEVKNQKLRILAELKVDS